MQMSSFTSSPCKASGSLWWCPSCLILHSCSTPFHWSHTWTQAIQLNSFNILHFSGTEVSFQLQECPSLSLKEMQQVLTISCPSGAFCQSAFSSKWSTRQMCFQLHLLHPLLLTSLFLPSVVFAHPIKTSSSQTPSVFFYLGTSLSPVAISFLQVR